MNKLESRIKSYQGFLRKWQIAVSILLLFLIGAVGLGKFANSFYWLVSLSNILLIPILIGCWDLFSSNSLMGKASVNSFAKKLSHFRGKQQIRQIVWIVLFVIGLCLAVFASLGQWDSIYVISGLGLVAPAGLFYLAALGLGLQSDWLLQSLNKDT